ncbi:MAG: transposase [Planctomycetota bacterium]
MCSTLPSTCSLEAPAWNISNCDEPTEYLGALGAQRIPDPTTVGNFCRRFSEAHIQKLRDALHEPRLKVWQQQPDSFLDLALSKGDGTLVETCGEKKEGIGMNYKRQWGYHPLVITLANTREVLYLANRSGNRPSQEDAAGYFDRSVRLCREAGFRKVRLRGDTDYSQTTHLDRWHEDGVEFVFGMEGAQTQTSVHGLQHVPATRHSDPGSDSEQRSSADLSHPDMETIA